MSSLCDSKDCRRVKFKNVAFFQIQQLTRAVLRRTQSQLTTTQTEDYFHLSTLQHSKQSHKTNSAEGTQVLTKGSK